MINRRLTVLIVAVFAACSTSEEVASDLVNPMEEVRAGSEELLRKGAVLFYRDAPLNGFVLDYYEDGNLKSKTTYIKGKKHGTSHHRYQNGSIKEIREYAENNKVGYHRGYWPNGNLKFTYHFKDGMHHGVAREWFVHGQMFKQFNFVEGREDGSQKMWTEDGAIRANYVVKDGRRYGLIGLKNCKSVSDETGLYASLAY